MRSGIVAVAGRPNVGKSTLVNAICGGKVAIVSDKPQTTRHRIRGVATGDDYQLVLVDLPGFQRPRDALTERMQRTVDSAFDDVEAVLFVLSARERIGALREELVGLLPGGPRYFPKGELTDLPVEDRIGELVREKALELTREEVPHAVSVEVEEVEDGRIRALVYVETDSQKGIVVGKGGRMIKEIGSRARPEIELLLGRPVYLELNVKVRPKWRRDDRLLERLGI